MLRAGPGAAAWRPRRCLARGRRGQALEIARSADEPRSAARVSSPPQTHRVLPLRLAQRRASTWTAPPSSSASSRSASRGGRVPPRRRRRLQPYRWRRRRQPSLRRRPAEIGSAISAVADKLGKLTQLAQSRSLFDEEGQGQEISALTFIIKQDITALNSRLNELQQAQRQRPRGGAKQRGEPLGQRRRLAEDAADDGDEGLPGRAAHALGTTSRRCRTGAIYSPPPRPPPRRRPAARAARRRLRRRRRPPRRRRRCRSSSCRPARAAAAAAARRAAAASTAAAARW